MRKLILAAGLIAGFSFTGLAQPTTTVPVQKQQRKNMSPEERAKDGAERAEKKLGLNEDQKSKWEAAYLRMMAANKPGRDKLNGSTTPEERKEIHKQMKENSEIFDTEVNSFLTPDQKAKREQMRAEKRHRRRV